ncbi:hypothetical protein [Gimesia aquarii]|uniref:Auto-transporter adhesin head GIN domain-containing protein n=1 Tax=Gimesia aquarii TaxID=2527964 RepID=A0A517VTF3_9PLAN|nr:hypothetical protein [Gimesia aquarii]QDT96294.1 hypothetical protein V144x_17480 [Gimesia aquarii]
MRTVLNHLTSPLKKRSYLISLCILFVLSKSSVCQSAYVDPPPIPTKSLIVQESINNYYLLRMNPQFGVTGLVAVTSWKDDYYGEITPGTCFLFPGQLVKKGEKPKTWIDPLPKFKNVKTKPLFKYEDDPNAKTMHSQLIKMLGRKPTDFIGFAAKISVQGSVINYNSRTCNIYWFGNRTLPNNWKHFVKIMMHKYVPPVSREIIVNGTSKSLKNLFCDSAIIKASSSGSIVITNLKCLDLSVEVSSSSTVTISTITNPGTTSIKSNHSAFVNIGAIETTDLNVNHSYSSSMFLGRVGATKMNIVVDYSSRLDITNGHIYLLSGTINHTSFVRNVAKTDDKSISVKNGSTYVTY